MMDITFAHPKFLFLLLLVPLFIYWSIQKRHKAFASFNIPTLEGIKSINSLKVKLLPLLNVLRIVGYIALVLALARPQKALSEREVTTEGIDIVLALDVSGSMLALDFQPDRLGAAKIVAQEFIDSRPNDRIGLVVFAGESFTQCPITTDHAVLTGLFKNVKSGLIEDGTAIGMGLATGVSRLKESDAVSKVVIIMTDGVNNAGYIDPLTAVELAKSEGVRVYTIGVGNNGTAPYPAKDMFGRTVYQNVEVNIDEDLLKTIAQETGGQYFRATNNETLKSIYNEIDQLEKSKVNVSAFERKSEHFFWFAFIAIVALFAEILLSNTFLRKLI
jgi:Ca-activated chloride channel family protein